jgi:penicillin-binding protein 2
MVKLGRKRGKTRYDKREKDIDPDEIFIDSSNLPNFDTYQFEGRIEKSISQRTLFFLGGVFLIIFLIFIGKVWSLQVTQGNFYFTKSENNRLRNSLIFAKRGIIYDRNNIELAWNVENTDEKAFGLRKYIPLDGFAHLLGYVKYPSKDKYGFYYSDVFDGKDGVEKHYNVELSGKNGKRIVEVDALGEVQSENIIQSPKDGENLKLSIDSGLQAELYSEIKELAGRVGFTGGAAVFMNVETGEILAMTSYPEYNSQVLTDGQDKTKISKYFTDKSTPSLNRVVDGLYTPGSTVKPYIAYAALREKVIDPLQNILSTGSISLPNPYDPDHPTVFKDWKAHGYVDMRRALAVSSDVYFYEVGGGFQDQKGLGILTIDKYMSMFGFSSQVPFSSALFSGPAGIIPTPEWKAENFDGEEWRVGNTYHTSIGQYGFQISPLHLVRAVSALANGGKLVTPQIISGAQGEKVDLKLDPADLKVVREGMRDGVTKDYGVAKTLNGASYTIAAKTGTAELGQYKQFVNSWISGFFPYENPKYAFVVIMEKGPAANTTGGVYIMRQTLDWLLANRPEYLR